MSMARDEPRTSQMPAYNPRRPSISSTMHWLSRKDSKATPEPSSELKGATIVRTPQDALWNTNVRVTFEKRVEQESKHESPTSPPLPPLPLPLPVEDEVEVLQDTPKQPHQSSRAARASSPSSSLKSMSSTAVEILPHVPSVPSHIPLSAPVPPFAPILVSSPTGIDPIQSKIIVTLETSTATYKSTLPTLCSRPSFLAEYLSSLINGRNSQASSVYSTQSADDEIYRDRLASQGLQPSASLHIFLDRPSAPYAHILTFLRTPSSSSEYPTSLPRAVQLSSLTHSTSTSLFNAKLEALLELRDETAYLGLDSLYKLCTDEIRQRLAHATRLARGSSHASVNTMMGPGLLPSVGGGGSSSVHSQQASVYSLHTLIENAEGDQTACDSKEVLARASQGSESLEGSDTSPVIPLCFSASPLPVPVPSTTTPAPPRATSTVSAPPTTRTPSSPRHIKSPSAAAIMAPSTTTAKTNRISKTTRSSSKSSSPSYTPPHSASSSPSQGYTRPPYLHKKAGSVSVLSPRSSPPSSFNTPSFDIPVLGALKGIEGRKERPSHTPLPSVVGVGTPPGWL